MTIPKKVSLPKPIFLINTGTKGKKDMIPRATQNNAKPI